MKCVVIMSAPLNSWLLKNICSFLLHYNMICIFHGSRICIIFQNQLSRMAFGGIMMELWYSTNQIWDKYKIALSMTTTVWCIVVSLRRSRRIVLVFSGKKWEMLVRYTWMLVLFFNVVKPLLPILVDSCNPYKYMSGSENL